MKLKNTLFLLRDGGGSFQWKPEFSVAVDFELLCPNFTYSDIFSILLNHYFRGTDISGDSSI